MKMRDLEKRIWDLEMTVSELFYALKCLLVYENQENARKELERAQSLFLGRSSAVSVDESGRSSHSPDSPDGPGVIPVAPVV